MSCCADFSTSKAAPADLDYRFEWEDELEDGDSITSSTWSVQTGSGITQHDAAIDGTDTVVWLAAGTRADVSWIIANEIQTADGRTEYKTLALRIC